MFNKRYLKPSVLAGMGVIAIVFASLGAGLGFWMGGAEAAPGKNTASSRIWVFMKDGSKSCGAESPDEVVSIEKARGVLTKAGVQVFDAKKGQDGKLHVQMCGADTGSQNQLLIEEKDLKKAQSLGFEKSGAL